MQKKYKINKCVNRTHRFRIRCSARWRYGSILILTIYQWFSQYSSMILPHQWSCLRMIAQLYFQIKQHEYLCRTVAACRRRAARSRGTARARRSARTTRRPRAPRAPGTGTRSRGCRHCNNISRTMEALDHLLLWWDRSMLEISIRQRKVRRELLSLDVHNLNVVC